MTDRIGQQLGNYRLIGLLGKGGFADTYLGEHIYLKTFAAIKVLQTQLQQQSDQVNFRNEAHTIAHLKHPNIVHVLDFGVDGETNTPYLVMDYASNGTLRQRHRRGVPLPAATIVPYVRNIASALQYAHERQIVHRDVKPENMLLGSNDEVLLSDFGIAVISQHTQSQKAQDIAGTVTYMAPEQIQGKARPASDQYALGVVVYEWLCGVVPFNGTYIEVAMQHERATPVPLRQRVASIPPDVEQVVLNALQKDPQRRFGSIQAFANALEQASKGAAAPSISQVQTAGVDPQMLQATERTPQFSSSPMPAVGPYSSPTPTPIVPGLTDPYSPRQTPPHTQDPYQQPISSGSQGPATPLPLPSNSFQNPYAARPTPSYPPEVFQHDGQTIPPAPPPFMGGQTIPSAPPPFEPQPPNQPPFVQPQAPTPQRRFTTLNIVLLGIVVLLLILSASGLIYYTNVYRPNQLRADATSTAVAQVTGTALAQTHANATAAAQATGVAVATATAYQNIYTQATSGTPTMTDPLSGGDNYGWYHFTSATESCNFVNGGYHIRTSLGYFAQCLASATNFSDLAFQVEETIISGTIAGLVFRSPTNTQFFACYQFYVNTDGTYNLNKVSNDKNGTFTPLRSGSSSAIHTGLNQTNLIAIVARGNTIYLYVNKQFITSVSDDTYKSGSIGVAADTNDTSGAEAVFRNLKVWQL